MDAGKLENCFYLKFANEVNDNEFSCKTVKIGKIDTKLLYYWERRAVLSTESEF